MSEHLRPTQEFTSSKGGNLKILTATPEGPDATAIPVYLAPGAGRDADSDKTELLLDSIAAHGREAWAIQRLTPGAIDNRFYVTADGETRLANRNEAWNALANIATSEVVSLEQIAAADDMLAALDVAGIDRTDAMLQSADALNGLIAANRSPERFNNIILAYPGGLVRHPKPINNIRSLAGYSIKDKLATSRGQAQTGVMEREPGQAKGVGVKRFLGKAAVGMMIATTHSYQGDMLTTLRQREQRPGVSIVVGLRDWMINYKDIIGSLGSADNVDYILFTEGGHAIKGDQAVLGKILDLFPAMEERKHNPELAASPLRDRIIVPDYLSNKQAEQIRALADSVAA